MCAPMSKADAAAVFAALGDAQRLRVVALLEDGGERSIVDLASGSTISRQALRKHLGVLEQAGLVGANRFGREVRFRIERAAIADAETFLAKVGAQWDDALSRLKRHLDG